MIEVIDAMCGAGKSTRIFEMMRQDPDKKYLYITPFLEEAEERVPTTLPELKFKSPSEDKGSKSKDLLKLLERGVNISSTHSLFGMFTQEIMDKVIEQDYVLVIDEAIKCIGILGKEFRPSDARMLKASEAISEDVNRKGKLVWNEEKHPEHDGRYEVIRNLCNMDSLYYFEDTFFMFEYPPRLLKELSKVYILTYLFQGSDMRCWLDINKIPYCYADHKALGLRDAKEIKQIVRENLTIIENRTLNSIRQRETAFSSRWFSNVKKDDLDRFKGIMVSTMKMEKARSGEVFWTTFKSVQKRLEGHGYTSKVGSGLPPFLPFNTRAINTYKDYRLCMYACNVYKHPTDVRYMLSYGVQPDVDTYALSEMIQFIWRGRIRQEQPMKVLILSKRMRKLLENWLAED